MMINIRDNLFKNRLTPLILLFGLVLLLFGILLGKRLDSIIVAYESDLVAMRVQDAAKMYSNNLNSELNRLADIAAIMENSDTKEEKDSLKSAVKFIDNNYSDTPNVFVGLLACDCSSIYGEPLSPMDYSGIRSSLRGSGAISYTPSGGVLFSYPIQRGGNVRYVLYELCSSSSFRTRFTPSIFNGDAKVMILTKDNDIVIPFSLTDKDSHFYESHSVRKVFDKLSVRMDTLSSIAVLEETTEGDKYFFTADVDGTDFLLAGSADRADVSKELSTVPRLVLSIFSLMFIMVMALSFFLMLVSVRVQESDELQKAINIAKEASRAKSDFLANMSHEIRTPINTVLGMDEMILRECNDPTLRKYALNIQRASKSLLGLINDILDFSKIEAGKMELHPDDYDLSMLIVDMINMVQVRAVKKGLTLDVNVNESMPHILYGDHIRLRQIILNLLTNAVKYTREGGVTLSFDYERLDSKHINMKVKVQDTGIGISHDDLDRLFFAFERLDEDRNSTIEGTGLGMNIVHSLLELMGSKPEVESVYGEGSTFSFNVSQTVLNWEPIGNIESSFEAVPEHETAYQASFAAPNARILLVDDTEMNLLVVTGLLKTTLVSIDTALDGKQALSLTEKSEYDLLLIDHRMPVMDGVEMLKALRADHDNPNHDKPCIALTANVISGAREEYLAAGFDDYLIKPVDSNRLEQALIQFLPEDKVTLPETIDTSEADKPADEPMVTGDDALNIVEERGFLDIHEGIEYSGSREMYINILKFFAGSIDDKSDEIRTLFEAKDWENYTTKVHALKSSAKSIGAGELSRMARSLELACIDKDYKYVEEHTGNVLTFYGSYKEKLKGVIS